MGASNEELLKTIRYYQESLDKYTLNKNNHKLLSVIEKLKRLPISTSHLEDTGIGRTVNALRKLGGDIGDAAKNLVTKWKEMVVEEEEKAKREAPEESAITEEDVDNYEEMENGYVDSVERESSSSHRSSDTERKSSEKYKYDVYKHTSSNDTKKDKSKDKENSSKKRKGRDSGSEGRSSKKRSKSYSESEEETYEERHKKSKSERRYRSDSSDDDEEEEEEEIMRHKSKRSKYSSDDTSDSEDSYREHKPKSSKSSKDDRSSSKSKSRDKTEVKKHDYDNHSSKDKEKSKSKHRSDSKSKRDSDSEEGKHKSKKEKSLDIEEVKIKNKHESKSRHDKDSSKPKEFKSHSSHSEKHETKDKKENKSGESKDKHSHKKDELRKHEEKHKKSKDEKESNKKEKSSTSSLSKSEEYSKSSSSKHKSSSENKIKDKERVVKLANKEKIAHGIDSGSGASFADALGMCEPIISTKTSSNSKKKKSSISPTSEKPTTSSSYSKPEKFEEVIEDNVPNLLKLEPPEPLNINISSLLPEITPHYKPIGLPLDTQPRRVLTQDEALSQAISNKNIRTKVYSGNKTHGKVETLFDLCVRVLQDNIDALEYTGGVPYSILKPVLDRTTPDQLFNMEHHNPYLIEDTDELWQLHCQKEFRTKKREELESWREMYMRCLDEREARLNAITANIKQSQDKSIPVRTTKLAYIDSVVKPPRNILRKQAKNGIIVDKKPAQTPSSRLSALATAGEAGKVAVPNPGSRAVERSSNSSSTSTMKPKKAPLMAKTLSLLKNRFRR